MKKYKDIMGRINYGVFLLTVALLPFPQIALRYAVVALGVTWLLEGRWIQGFKDSILNSQFSIINFPSFSLVCG